MSEHIHEPTEPIAALVQVCRGCGEPIEAIPCRGCDGTGIAAGCDCPDCGGSGIAGWRVAT